MLKFLIILYWELMLISCRIYFPLIFLDEINYLETLKIKMQENII